jgi:hypothetical protein
MFTLLSRCAVAMRPADTEAANMLEESLDPRPNFEAVLAEVLSAARHAGTPRPESELARLWDDRQADWVNLRNFGHWLERAR